MGRLAARVDQVSGLNKDITDLIRLAREQGWKITYTKKHVRWHPPGWTPGGCETYYQTSRTPSDGNIVNTIKSDLQKKGLILDRSEWKRMKDREEQEPLPPSTPLQGDVTLIDRRMTDEEILADLDAQGYDLSIFSTWQLATLVNMFRYTDPATKPECLCGMMYHDLFALYTHISKNDSEPGHGFVEGTPEPEPDAAADVTGEALVIPAESPGSSTHPPLETAPGSDVKASDFRILRVHQYSDIQAVVDDGWELVSMQPDMWTYYRNEKGIVTDKVVASWVTTYKRNKVF